MRRLALSFALFALTGTLIAQVPQSPIPLTQPDRFQCMVSFSSAKQDGDKVQFKDARLTFGIGVTITADEASFDKAKDGVVQLSGNVQVLLKK